MLVILPTAGTDLTECEHALSPERLTGLMQGLRPTRVALSLPKFEVASHSDQRDALSGMGMADAFSPKAEFNGISARAGLYPRAVLHAARFSVDERGAKGGAATSIAKTMDFDDQWTQFKVDRPFIFAVRHNPSGAFLFIGRIEDPARASTSSTPEPGQVPHLPSESEGSYKDEAVRALLEQASDAARSLKLNENLPITQRDTMESFILSEPGSLAWGAIGMVGTSNYRYYASRTNKLTFIVRKPPLAPIAGSPRLAETPIGPVGSDQEAYTLATNWLASFGADVPAMMRDCRLRITSAPALQGTSPFPQKNYMVFWQRPGQSGSAASIQLSLPAKDLLQLRVDDQSYNRRLPILIGQRRPPRAPARP